MNDNSQNLENYLYNHIEEEPNLLKSLRKETYQKTTQPHMISGVYQGRLLSFIAKIIQPKKILEIGTFTGYSTLCLAESLDKKGKLVTIDQNKELVYLAQKYFELSQKNSQIEFIIEDAKKVIPTLDETFDLVFLDADKQNYSLYYDLVFPKLNKNAIILADNVLWYGKVLETSKEKKTKALQDFNLKVKNDSRVEVVILPIRDGISLIRKKE